MGGQVNDVYIHAYLQLLGTQCATIVRNAKKHEMGPFLRLLTRCNSDAL